MNLSEIYVIADADGRHLKVGRSQNSRGRLRDLQTGNPRPLRLVECWSMRHADALEVERIVHEELAFCRRQGEWFDDHEALIVGAINWVLRDHNIPTYEDVQ